MSLTQLEASSTDPVLSVVSASSCDFHLPSEASPVAGRLPSSIVGREDAEEIEGAGLMPSH